MKWNKDKKEQLNYLCAVVMLIFGIALAIAGFIVPPIGVIHGTVIGIFSQTLLFSGSIMGISLHFNNKLETFQSEVRKEIRNEKDK